MKILIIGAGKMGTWFADELCLEHDLAVYDSNPLKLKYLFKTERFTRLEEIINFKPDMVINAVPIQDTIQVFDEISKYLPKDCVLSDICSVKNGVSSYYKNSNFRFVSTHPMFGPTFAQMHQLKSQNAIIVSESNEEGSKFFEDFYRQFEINIHKLSFAEHDQTIAYSLSIPFASTLIFSSCMKEQKAPGTTFQKHLEIAKGLLSEDNFLLSEILMAKNSIYQIEKIRDNLTSLLNLLEEKNVDGVREFISSSRNKVLRQDVNEENILKTALNSNVGF